MKPEYLSSSRGRAPDARIKADLSAIQRAALAEDCALLGVSPVAWTEVPTLRIKYESVAAAARALRIMEAEQDSWTRALLRACVQLGLSYEAVRKRLGGWRQIERRLPGGAQQ